MSNQPQPKKNWQQISSDSVGYSQQMGASGEFIQTDLHGLLEKPLILVNPGNLRPVEYSVTESLNLQKEWHWIEKLKSKKQPWAEMDDFVDYTRAIIKVAESLVPFEPACSLGPLRGASFPCSLTETTSYGRLTFDYFNYRTGQAEENHPRVLGELRQIIAKRNLGLPQFRLAIVDTAIGGYGINSLVKLLKRIWQEPAYRKQQWRLSVHLLHDLRQGTDLEHMNEIEELIESGKFDIELSIYRVSKLITEDYSKAIDFRRDDRTGFYTPASHRGKLILLDGNEAKIIEAEDAFQLYLNFFIEGARRSFERNPNYTLKSVIWERTFKGSQTR